MKKLLLFFSATLFALGTAFAQAVLPTADLFAVQGPETSYDESAGTVTFTWQISLAEGADVQWSDFVGQEAQVWFNNTLSAPNTVISEDGQVVSKTFSGAQDGSEIAYRLVFACGTSDKYQGTAVTLQESTYTPEGEVEPEPEPVTVSIVAQYLNGNAAFSSTMTVPVATANADGDVDVTCQFYYYSAADEYAQATSVGEVFSDNTEGSLVVDDVEIQASSAFPLPAGTYKFEAVWMYGEDELRTGLSTEVVVPEPDPEISIYLAGGSFGDGLLGVVEEETETATWTFEEPATVSGSFAIEISILAYGSEAADVYYVGPETAGSIVLNEGTAVVEVVRTEEQGNMFVVPEGETWTVSSIVLQGGSENTNGTVTITASVIPTAIDETEAAVVTAADGRIYAEGEFTIVNLAGQDVTDANGSLQGTYIVIAGDDAVKVYVD